MPPVLFYRYVGPNEMAEIRRIGIIKSNRRLETWWTTLRTDDPDEARNLLALPYSCEYRVGPVPPDEMPDFDHTPLEPVPAVGPSPGEALQAATTNAVYVTYWITRVPPP